MIYQDANGFPVSQSLDGGDSSMRAGMIALTGMKTAKPVFLPFYEEDHSKSHGGGWLKRHPEQYPWDNVWNFTPDQMKPVLAGLSAVKQHALIRRIFFKQCLRFIFCQDFQEDVPGSWKRPWPFTYPNGERMNFNFATPLLPNDLWCMIAGGKLYPLYLLYPICLLFTLLAIFTSGEHQEQNQMIAELSFHPKCLTRLYRNFGGWAGGANNAAYWYNRNEGEYADAIAAWVMAR